MPEQHVSDHLLERLRAWGVRRLYGYSGDGINGLLGALNRAGNQPEFVHSVHEELASLMACAHAKFTGEVGVCTATSGPGAIHLLNGLYDAKLDHQPVVAIIGQQARPALGSAYQQEIDLRTLLKDVAGAYLADLTHPAQVAHVVDRAFRIALDERTVTAIIIPHDVQDLPAQNEQPHEHGYQHSSVGYAPARRLPHDEDLRRAADILNAGARVAILAGAGALHAGAELTLAADAVQGGVAKALLGKAALPDDLPFVTGSVGWLGTEASNHMLQTCDTLLMVGTGFPYTEYLPREGQARTVQIDRSASRVGLRTPTEVNLIGDSAETLRALLPLLHPKPRGAWREDLEARARQSWADAERAAQQDAPPLNPARVASALSRRLPPRSIITADSGTSAVWLGRHLRLREGMMASLSGTLATMGSAVPYALAAKLNFPDRPVIALAGDGAMQMSGNAGLIAVAQQWRAWADPRLVVVVLNNRDLNYVTWEQRAMEGHPKFPASQDLPDVPFARYAELLGLQGVRVDDAGHLEDALEVAFGADRPVVLEAVVSAHVPTLPPTLTAQQRQHLQAALADDPDAAEVKRQLRQQGYTL
ncbi:thiamine pyrophosphate-requiring protein [Deinococcus maricopensis]|uniref:Pyruvate dehydrogenase (Cytochrome) n=1 Tax=Deinococcus maricopensis (strain DSM 21211 / LMG 22137 / NRRL B-23946 / LB-34) TaxID=709986 RepID=E8U3A9_DEIML|nr:thiamine pyrophosphate-requiring protein [Deinococcus maricopensis]ADV65780.1 Pyruvate dehydrogenase (cytochrome) [Deinococcus maricopensis DSM 21211]